MDVETLLQILRQALGGIWDLLGMIKVPRTITGQPCADPVLIMATNLTGDRRWWPEFNLQSIAPIGVPTSGACHEGLQNLMKTSILKCTLGYSHLASHPNKVTKVRCGQSLLICFSHKSLVCSYLPGTSVRCRVSLQTPIEGFSARYTSLLAIPLLARRCA